MALRTETEILKAVDDREKELKDLRTRFENDYGLWRLMPYRLGKQGEYDNYTSSGLQNLANKVMEILANALLQIRIPLRVEGEQERAKIANAERFVYGAINLANSRLQYTVRPSIQEQLAFFSTLRGWFAIRALIHQDNGETIPDIAVWDLLQTTWDAGANNLLWVCHRRQITASQAKAEYDVDLKTKTAKLYDFWDDEVNAVLINNQFVKKPKEHGLKHLPVLVSAVGPAPFIQSEQYQDTIKDVGESIYGPNRNLIEPKNKLMTYILTKVGQGVHAPMGVWSAGGKKTLDKSPYYKGAVINFDSDKGEKAETLLEPSMPRDYAALLDAVNSELTMGGALPLLWGIDQPAGSGYRANLLTHAASTILWPRQRTMESSLEWLARELLTQYAGGGFGKLRLHGRDGSNEYFDIELSSTDVKGDWFPEVKLLPSLPEDTAGKYAMAQLAVVNELLSKETARDKLLGVQDPDIETQKILREKAMNMPAILLRRMAASLIQEGRPDLAQIFVAELERLATPAPRQRGEEAVRPEYATGMPGTVLPPEEMGRTQLPPGERERMTQDLKLRMMGLERG